MAVRGIAAGMIAGGFVLAYSAIKDASLSDTVRDIIRGVPVPGSTSETLIRAPDPIGGSPPGHEPGASFGEGGTPSSSGAGIDATAGAAIVADAAKYLGIKYVFGGASPAGFDCSGLVTYVLHHDLGYSLPSNAHTVTGQFYIWSGAVDVPYSQMQPGDLVCYAGHIGIAAGGGQMINAPTFGQVVKYSKIWTVPMPKIRRVKPQ